MEHVKSSQSSLSDDRRDLETHGKEDAHVNAPNAGPWDPAQFPDGGTQAWLVVAGAFCFNFCSMGWINCIGIFQDYYQNNYLLHYSPSEISWIASLEVFVLFGGGIAVGRLYDKFGPRWLLLFGSFMHIFGLFMLSLGTTYYQLMLSQGVCSPIGITCLFTPPLSCTATWFMKKRGLALGIVSGGSAIGGIILPILLNHLIPEIGFPWAIRTAAFMLLTLLAFANIVTSARLPPRPASITVGTYFRPLTEMPYVITTAAASLFFLGLWLPLNYLEVQAAEQGMRPDVITYLIPIVNAASLFGRVVPGYIGDRMGPFNTMSVMCSFCGIVTFAIWVPTRNDAALIVYAILYGLSSGAFTSLLPALIGRISEIKQIGARLGMVFAIISISGLVSNPIGGAFISLDNGRYRAMQIWCGTVMLAGSMLFILARFTVSGPKMMAAV